MLASGVFCLLVALEEISSGQWLREYRPSAYFLEESDQREFNVPNTMSDRFREAGFLGVCCGCGVVLPLAQAWCVTWDRLFRLGGRGVPLEFSPSFAATGGLYQIYPWSHPGE